MGYGRRWNNRRSRNDDNVMMTRRRDDRARPMITTEARTSTTAEYERSLLSEMLPDTQRFSARAIRYNERQQPMVGSDAYLTSSMSNNGRVARGGRNNYVRNMQSYEYAQQPSLLSVILPDPPRSSAYAIRNRNNAPSIVGSDAYASQSMKGGRGEYYDGDGTTQQPSGPTGQMQTSFLSDMLPDNRRLLASAIGYNVPPVVGSDASLSQSSQQTSMLSGYLPDTQRSSAVTTKYYSPPTVIGSDASLSTMRSRGYNGQEDSFYGTSDASLSQSSQQTSMLSRYLPDTQRYSAVTTKYYSPPTIIGSDASLSTTRSRGYNGQEDSYYGQDSQPFGFAQQTSVLSEMLPDTQRNSAEAIRYNEPPVVGSDASLSPSTPRGYSSGAERNFGTIGPKKSPMLDWFSASTSNPGVLFSPTDYDNGNSLSALASSFQVSRPSSRTYNDGSVVGGFSPSNGIGGSDAMGGGGTGMGRAFDHGVGDQSPVESIRDAGVKVQPNSVLGSIASASTTNERDRTLCLPGR
ncbi:hypothetical protein ACHAXA_008954 [Cyclostephanos tholiformis]|uniref:Uncharacterized protein n=1 Tax=Cyclostephanos tholiformis TaxID=382380 RepID=A0ABD3R699_9STRA